MSIEFDVGGNTYSASRLDAFTALHAGRRLAPLMGYITASGGTFASVIEALAMARQDDLDYIVHNALKSVKRKSGTAWAPVYNVQAAKLSFEDIDALQMLEITSRALEADVLPFFKGLVNRASDMPLTRVLGADTSEPTTTTS